MQYLHPAVKSAAAVLVFFAVLIPSGSAKRSSPFSDGMAADIDIDLNRSIGIETLPVRVFYTKKNERIAVKIAEICAETVPGLAAELGLLEITPFEVQVIPDLKPYQGNARNDLPSWGVAFAFMESQVMLVDARRAANAWNSLEEVVPHELSHILLAQRVGSVAMPLWFVEGLAQWQAGQWSLLESWRLMESVWTRRAPPLGRIAAAYPREEAKARDAYRISYAAFTFLFKDETEKLAPFLSVIAEKRDFSDAFAVYWNENIGDFYLRFHESIQKRYSSRLFVFQTGPLFAILAVIFIFIFLRVKMRNRKKLKKMEKSEIGLSFDDHR